MTQQGDPKVASNHEEIAKNLRQEGKKAARKIGKQISSELKSGDLAPKGAASRAREIDTEREKIIPDINKALRDLSNQVLKVLSDEDSKVIKFRELNEASEYASFRKLKNLHLEFLALASRAKRLAEEIDLTEHESYGKTIEENEHFARDGGNSGELVQLR